MKIIKYNNQEHLIRSKIKDCLGSSYNDPEERLERLITKFAQLIQLLADDNSLGDSSIKRLCNFAGCDKDIEIVDRKDLNEFNPAEHIHRVN